MPATKILIDMLNRSFQRVEQGATPAMNNYNGVHLVLALLSYARHFAEHPLLASVMAAERLEGQSEFYAMREEQQELAQKLVELFRELLDLARSAEKSEVLNACVLSHVTQEFFAHPELPEKQEALRGVFLEAKKFVGASHLGDAVRIRSNFLSYTKQSRDVEKRHNLLDSSKPWIGAEMVDAFAHAPERQNDIRMARGQSITINTIKAWLTGKGEEPSRWHRVDSLGALVLHVGVFHDRVISKLLMLREAEHVVRRFAERVERFERDEYRRLVQPDGNGGNRDERMLVRRLCVYLHDNGFMPFAELEAGGGRADTVAKREDAGAMCVAVEAKCIRVKDCQATIRDRVRKGASQAVSYARAHGLDSGHLVLFWANAMEPRIAPEWSDLLPSVSVVIVDLRDPPSDRATGPVVVDVAP